MHYVFLSQISFALFQFFLIFFILKNEGVMVLGFYGLFISILNPLQQFFKLGIPKLIVTAFEFNDQKKYYIISFYSFAIFLLVGMVISLVFISNKYYLLFIALLGFRALINFRESQQSIYIRNKLFKNYFQSVFVCNLLLIAFFWISYYYLESLSFSFVICCVIIIAFLIIDIFRQQYLVKMKSSDFFLMNNLRERLFRMMKLSVADGVFTLKSNLPRYIIASNFSIDLLGIYTALFQAVSVLEILNQSVLKFYYGRLTELFKAKSNKFKKIEHKIYLITTTIVVLSIIGNYFLGDFLLELFFGEEFLPYLGVLFILILERYFGMLNSVPKTIFILLDKIQVNIYTTIIVFALMFISLRSISDFLIFNIIIMTFGLLQFFINKVLTNRLIKNE